MNFVSQVMFSYDIKKGNIKVSGNLSDMNDLLKILNNSLNAKSFELILTRTVQIVDKDSKQKPVVLGNEKLNLVVTDELVYPKQVMNFLKQKYNDTFEFEKMPFALNNEYPVYFSGIQEIEELGPINPNTGDKTTFIRHYIQCRQLTNFDIVVNKKLHQIWPLKTPGKMPIDLIVLLAKNKEIIR